LPANTTKLEQKIKSLMCLLTYYLAYPCFFALLPCACGLPLLLYVRAALLPLCACGRHPLPCAYGLPLHLCVCGLLLAHAVFCRPFLFPVFHAGSPGFALHAPASHFQWFFRGAPAHPAHAGVSGQRCLV